MKRRDFIKSSCLACVSLMSTSILLNSCNTSIPLIKSSGKNNLISIAQDSFLENNTIIVRDKQSEFDILLVKETPEHYTALLMKCSHEAQPLTANKQGLFCSSHGSIFNLKGDVIKEPAIRPLKSYKTEIINQQIIIYLNS